jgi:hypothetical protein
MSVSMLAYVVTNVHWFLISNFRRVVNVVCFLLVNSPASEFYMPTFRNTLSVPSSYPHTKMEQTECSETLAYKIQTPENYPEESIKRTLVCLFLRCLRVTVPMRQGTATQILHAQARDRKHNHPDTSRTGTWQKAQSPRYFTHRHVTESTTTQILHAQARDRKHNHPDTSRTATLKKAQLPRYFTYGHIASHKPPRLSTKSVRG